MKHTIGLLIIASLSFYAESLQTDTARKTDHAINAIFANRWSSRAMSGEMVSRVELMSLFEAARWAPSSYNDQPWRFIYAFRDTPAWHKFFNLLVPFNQTWVKNGSVLVLAISHKFFCHNKEFSRTHSFDTGAAWENFALQGSCMNLVVHGMSGFDYERARKELAIPDDYAVEAMFVVGKPAPKENLPAELQAMETPSSRRKVEEFAFEGIFKNS